VELFHGKKSRKAAFTGFIFIPCNVFLKTGIKVLKKDKECVLTRKDALLGNS